MLNNFVFTDSIEYCKEYITLISTEGRVKENSYMLALRQV